MFEVNGVQIVGLLNLPSTMAYHASQLYARNVASLLALLAPGGELNARLGRRDHRGGLRHPEEGGDLVSHSAQLVVELTVLVLAIFLGIEVISKVPTLLHTPLMSGTNAIHGIVIVGAMLVAGIADPDLLTGWVGFVAMILAGGERGRRLRRHRSDARDVQETRAAEEDPTRRET